MTRPRNPEAVPNQKAPRAPKPETPFERIRADRPLVRPPDRRETERNAYPKANAAAADGTQSKNLPRWPGALINRRAADRLRGGYLWVYASDIESMEAPETGSGGPPALLPVADSRGLLLGTALYSPSSQIALRLISREAIDEATWLELLAARRPLRCRRRYRRQRTGRSRISHPSFLVP